MKLCIIRLEKNRSDAVGKAFEAEPPTSSLWRLQWKVEANELEVYCGADKEVSLREQYSSS